jgi:hypothetical protein
VRLYIIITVSFAAVLTKNLHVVSKSPLAFRARAQTYVKYIRVRVDAGGAQHGAEFSVSFCFARCLRKGVGKIVFL